MKPLIGGAIGMALVGATLAAASPSAPARGELIYRRCYACHALEPDRNTPAGPTLHDIVGRPIAAQRGFDYSPALRRLAARHRLWTRELLGRFLADPEAVAPGTEMGFIGMHDSGERRALIDWLGARRKPR